MYTATFRIPARYVPEMPALADITARLARGAIGRTEADIQADVRALLLEAPLYLADDDIAIFLEAQAGGGQRIDIEAGCAVVEVKKSLGSPTALAAAIEQLAKYVRYRTEERAQRYVGVLTDGASVDSLLHFPEGVVEEPKRMRAGDYRCPRASGPRAESWPDGACKSVRRQAVQLGSSFW